MPYPSPHEARERAAFSWGMGLGAVLWLAVLLLLLLGGCSPQPASAGGGGAPPPLASEPGANAVTLEELGVSEVRPSSEGPVYDLPDGWSSYAVHDRENREWVLVTNGQAAVSWASVDARGNQVVVENE